MGQFSWKVIFWEVFFLGSEFLGENFPGGIFPAGIFRGAFFQGAFFLEPKPVICERVQVWKTKYWIGERTVVLKLGKGKSKL